jgi:hypothetical protein
VGRNDAQGGTPGRFVELLSRVAAGQKADERERPGQLSE